MVRLDVFNEAGEKTGEVEFNDAVLGEKVRKRLMHEYIVMYEANRRQGTHKVKTVSDVKATGHKMYRQKGTGRARAHYRSSNIRTGGGVSHGPVPRDYYYHMPKKARRESLKSALLAKLMDGEVRVIDSLDFEEAKTNRLKKALKANEASRRALVVLADNDRNLALSARNLARVDLHQVREINTYQVLVAHKVLFTLDALRALEDFLGSSAGKAKKKEIQPAAAGE